MDRKRNFFPLAGFLICLVGFLSYFVLFARFPVTRDVPWANWLLFAAGLALAGAGISRAFRRPETYRGRVLGPILGGLSLAVVVFFLFATLAAPRQLPSWLSPPKVAEKAPDFTSRYSSGPPVA